MSYFNTKRLVTLSLLTAMCFVLSAYSIPVSPTLSLGFGVIPIVVAAMLYGGLSAGLCYALSNVMRVLYLGHALTIYDIPLTFICFLTGLVFGIFLYKKPKTIINILIPTTITCLVFNLIGNTYFMSQLFGSGFLAILPARLVKNIIQIPVNTFIIYSITKIKPIMNHANKQI